ncbi:MAG: hypothetical protein ACI9J2_000065 [Saprospiraceae bacterium]|jgi:hypothetical protein
MQAILDTHLHLYPEYDIEKAFVQFQIKAQTALKGTLKVVCLAERHDCHYFHSLHQADLVLPNYTIENVSEKEIKLTHIQSGDAFHLVAGRQVISSENIEVLALSCQQDIEDGHPAKDIIKLCQQAGGVAVVAWSPGKWFAKRGKVVQALLDSHSPSDFMLGDTTLRPFGWGVPWLMRKAMKKGYPVIAGSDPLPFIGEEKWFGAYCSHVTSTDTLNATELLQFMQTQHSNTKIINKGKRSNIVSLLQRLRNNAKSKVKKPV